MIVTTKEPRHLSDVNQDVLFRAYQRGWEAREARLPITNCTFQSILMIEEWLNGWHDKRREDHGCNTVP